MSYRFTDSLRSANLNDIYHCCVYSEKTPGEGQRNCPKRVEFYSKNKFEKLVHLVGFVIRIYHDARSPERQNIDIHWRALKENHKVSCVFKTRRSDIV